MTRGPRYGVAVAVMKVRYDNQWRQTRPIRSLVAADLVLGHVQCPPSSPASTCLGWQCGSAASIFHQHLSASCDSFVNWSSFLNVADLGGREKAAERSNLTVSSDCRSVAVPAFRWIYLQVNHKRMSNYRFSL